MKLLVVFVSALVLLAHGKVTPSNDEVYEIQPEVVVGNAVEDDAVEAVGSVEPQRVFAEETPAERIFDAEEGPRVFSPQEPQRAYEVENLGAESNIKAPESVYIPIISRVCTNPACASICRQLGFKNGFCVSLSTCWCFN